MANNDLDNLLMGEEPEEKKVDGRKEFKPTFNVREEFPLWIKEQFPDLKKYSKKKTEYKELEARREEVYQAALGAVNHGVTSTQDCASARLREGWTALENGFKAESDPKMRAKSLKEFVEAIEDLSISLGGNTHYTQAGKYLNDYSYGAQRGNIKAFIYRIGEEEGKKTKYQVFDKEQEFEGEDQPVLIGEFIQLTEWNMKTLTKAAENFIGPEAMFRDMVDRQVPDAGKYHYPTYSGAYVTKKDTPKTQWEDSYYKDEWKGGRY